MGRWKDQDGYWVDEDTDDYAEPKHTGIPMELPRQPEVVVIELEGDARDVKHYQSLIKRLIESATLDNVELTDLGCLTIYPAAVND